MRKIEGETLNTRRKVDLIYQEFCGSNAPHELGTREKRKDIGRSIEKFYACRKEKKKWLEAGFYSVVLELEINSFVFKLCTKEREYFFRFCKFSGFRFSLTEIAV